MQDLDKSIQNLIDFFLPYSNEKLSSPTFSSIGTNFTLLTSNFGYLPSAYRFIDASYKHKIRIDRPIDLLSNMFGATNFLTLQAGVQVVDDKPEPSVAAGLSGIGGAFHSTVVPRTRHVSGTFSTSTLLPGAIFHASFRDTLVNQTDYAAVDLEHKNGSSTFKIDSTGTVTAATVLHRNGIAMGAELKAPTRFSANYIAEKKQIGEPDCNFGLQYTRAKADYPMSISLKTKKQASEYLFTYHQEITPQVAVGIQFDSERAVENDVLSSEIRDQKESILNGWSAAARFTLDPNWRMKLKVLSDNTAALSLLHSAKNVTIQAGARVDIPSATNFRYGISATLSSE